MTLFGSIGAMVAGIGENGHDGGSPKRGIPRTPGTFDEREIHPIRPSKQQRCRSGLSALLPSPRGHSSPIGNGHSPCASRPGPQTRSLRGPIRPKTIRNPYESHTQNSGAGAGLALEEIKSRSNDDGDPDPGQSVWEIAEEQNPQNGGRDDFKVLERGDNRCRGQP